MADARMVPVFAVAPTPGDASVMVNVVELTTLATANELPLYAAQGSTNNGPVGQDAPVIVTGVPVLKPCAADVCTVAVVLVFVAVGVPVDVPATATTVYVNVLLPVFVTTKVPFVPAMLDPEMVTLLVPFGRL